MFKKQHNNIVEGLEKNDLERLIKPEVHIDEYKSKMGRDEDIVVTSFQITGREPAKDLVNFVEKGYDWVLDSDISSGELPDGDYIVFIESDRTEEYPTQLEQLIKDMLNLTNQKLSDWSILIRSNPDPLPFSIENVINYVPLTSEDYLRRYGTKGLDEMRSAAGVSVNTKAPINDYTQTLKSLAGII